MNPEILNSAFQQVIEKAKLFRGATAPNPIVGAAALTEDGRLLSVQAHERAGTGHAEAKVFEDLRARGLLEQAHTLLVTLEPCNHQGRTPPCCDAILASSVRRVIFGVEDPNPKVPGRGAQRLREAGLEVELAPADLHRQCRELLAPFARWIQTGLPYVTVKTAWLEQSGTRTMIPPAGSKTFTSAESLRLAHELRKRSDAILTGSGTVLADSPSFTVRHVPDHPGKRRWLVVLDRRGRVSDNWLKSREELGFRPVRAQDFREAIQSLGAQGVLEVLVEAGPELSQAILASDLWSAQVEITRNLDLPNAPDQIRIRTRDS